MPDLNIPETPKSFIDKIGDRIATIVEKNPSGLIYTAASLALLIPAAAETGWTLATGQPFLLGSMASQSLNNISTDGNYVLYGAAGASGSKPKEPSKFQKVFANHPVGKFTKQAIHFLASKPVKRAMRIGLMSATVAAGSAGTFGVVPAIVATGLAVSATGILYNSVQEYRSKVKMDSKIAETENLHALSQTLEQAQNSPKKQVIQEFLLGETSNRTNSKSGEVPIAEPSKTGAKIRAFGANFFESVGSFLSGDITSAGYLFMAGTMKEGELKFAHDTLKHRLYEERKDVRKKIAGQLGKDGFFAYGSLDDLGEITRRREILHEICRSNPTFLDQEEGVIKDQLTAAYKHSPYKKPSFFQSAIKHVKGYLSTAIPAKRFEYDPALLAEKHDETMKKPTRLVKPLTQKVIAENTEETLHSKAAADLRADLSETRPTSTAKASELVKKPEEKTKFAPVRSKKGSQRGK